MSLTPKRLTDLINPESFRLKLLIAALPGTGKTTFVGTAPNVAIAASETGHGKGLASIAGHGGQYCEPENYKEFETFCSGDAFKDADTLAVDSLSAMSKTFIKDYALTFPRKNGQTLKRAAGVPEMDDYQVMAEITRRLLAKLIGLDKHIIVTCTLKLPQEANPEEGKEALPGMPDLPGQLALASAAMFDAVLILRTRPVLANPKDPKSRFSQRYFMTEGTDKWLAKCRHTANGKSILAAEEVFDVPIVGQQTQGSFSYILNKILEGYKHEASVAKPVVSVFPVPVVVASAS